MKLGFAIALALVAACSESSTEPRDDQPAGDLPACTPRSPEIDAGLHAPDAIPTGACSTNGDRCALDIGYACATGGIGRIDRAQCTCSESKWTCAVNAAGPSTCPSAPAPADASTD